MNWRLEVPCALLRYFFSSLHSAREWNRAQGRKSNLAWSALRGRIETRLSLRFVLILSSKESAGQRRSNRARYSNPNILPVIVNWVRTKALCSTSQNKGALTSGARWPQTVFHHHLFLHCYFKSEISYFPNAAAVLPLLLMYQKIRNPNEYLDSMSTYTAMRITRKRALSKFPF